MGAFAIIARAGTTLVYSRSSLTLTQSRLRWAGFNFNVEEWDAEGQTYEILAICRTLALARAAFAVAIEEKPTGRFIIRSRTAGRGW